MQLLLVPTCIARSEPHSFQGLPKFCKGANACQMLQATDLACQQGIQISESTVTCILQNCIKEHDLAVARQVHAMLLKHEMQQTPKLTCQFIRTFAFCGSLPEAMQIFRSFDVQNVHSWSAIVSVHAQANNWEQTLLLYEEMVTSSFQPSFPAIHAALKACTALSSSQKGKIIHNDVVKADLQSDLFVSSALVDMYAKCGSLQEAIDVFNKLPVRDVVSWCTMIGGFVKHGDGSEALRLYDRMEKEGIQPNKITLVCLLKACVNIGSVDEGKSIHLKIVKLGFEADAFAASTLIDMYIKCYCVIDARQIFNDLHDRDVVAWNSMITGYADTTTAEEALYLFDKMQKEGKHPDRITYIAAVKAHGIIGNLHESHLLHADIIMKGLDADICISSSLVDLYAKCGHLGSAQATFERLSKPDVISWSSMILGYVEHGFSEKALQHYKLMLDTGTEPDKITFICVCKACALFDSSSPAKLIHADIVNQNLDSDFIIGSALIDLYFKHRSFQDAVIIFQTFCARNVALWNCMLTGYSENGHDQEVFQLFHEMEKWGIEMDEVSFVCLLRACGSSSSLIQGDLIHSKLTKRGFDINFVLANALIDMYGKRGDLENVSYMFDKLHVRNVVSWSALITAMTDHGDVHKVISCYDAMIQNGVPPNEVVYVGILRCCAILGSLSKGKLIHMHATKQGFDHDECIGNVLIAMYTKCGNLNEAYVIFDCLPNKTVVTWSSLIAGHVDHGLSEEALYLFSRMREEGVYGNEVTLITILKACSSLVDIFHGKQIHIHMMTKGLDTITIVGNTLIDMYSKCGDLRMANEVFYKMNAHDAVTLNAMIGGFADHGCYDPVKLYFERMIHLGLKPDDITLVNVLTACSHAGLLSESYYVFKSIGNEFCLVPTMEHYICLFDGLRRADRLDDVETIIENMPYSPCIAFWIALLSSCSIYKNLNIGNRAYDNLIETDRDNIPGLILMSNISMQQLE